MMESKNKLQYSKSFSIGTSILYPYPPYAFETLSIISYELNMMGTNYIFNYIRLITKRLDVNVVK